MKKLLVTFSIATLSLLFVSTAHSAQHQSHKSIQAAAKSFLSEKHQHQIDQVNIRINRLDRRLRLHQCTQSLETFISPGSRDYGRTTVGVRCDDGKPWTIYVSAQVELHKPVVVAVTSIPRGQLITAEDVTIENKNVSSLRFGYISSIDAAVNTVAKRHINVGKILTKQIVGAPKLVRRGEQVTILSSNRQFRVSMAGKALSDGIKGKRIRVKNNSSKRVIEATVTAPGIVMVSY